MLYSFPRASVSRIKQFWHDYPQVMFSIPMGVVAIVLTCCGVLVDEDIRAKYKQDYMVHRIEDARPAWIRKRVYNENDLQMYGKLS